MSGFQQDCTGQSVFSISAHVPLLEGTCRIRCTSFRAVTYPEIGSVHRGPDVGEEAWPHLCHLAELLFARYFLFLLEGTSPAPRAQG